MFDVFDANGTGVGDREYIADGFLHCPAVSDLVAQVTERKSGEHAPPRTGATPFGAELPRHLSAAASDKNR